MHIRIFSSNPMSRVRLIGRAMTEDFHRKFSRNRHRLSSRIPWSCTSWSEIDEQREREARWKRDARFAIAYAFCASHMHYFAMVYATAIRVCTRVYSFSLSLSLLADPSAIFSVSLARSRSLLHSLGARCVHVSRVAEGRVQEGARHGEMGGREKRMRWERWLAKGGRGARAVLSACVSDVLMTLRNTEQANQYGSRHSACALAALSRPFSRY